MNFNTVLAVGAGGALGAVLRYWVYHLVHALLGRGFPYGTFAVNLTGSLAMGFAYVWLFDRLNVGIEARAFVLIGLLGGFTTFSAFSIETLNLLEKGETLAAFVNVGASVSLCVAAAWLGTLAGRAI